MGTALTGLEIRDTYDALIKITDNGPLSGTAKYLSDGLGNDSALALSTAGVGVGTTTISSVGSTKVLEVGTTASGGTLTLGGSTAFRISGSTSGVDMYYAASAPINIYTAGTERVRIDATGNVGIGTSSPAYKLDVTGDIRTSVASGNGSLYINNSSLTSKFWTFIPETAAGETNLLFFYGGTGAGTKMTITSAGNVGIGTSSPLAPIQINGAPLLSSPARATIRTFDTSSPAANVGAGLMLGYQFDTGQYVDAACVQAVKENATLGNYATSLAFLTRANGAGFVENVRITSAGNVGIGTSSPQGNLDVKGSTNVAVFLRNSSNGDTNTDGLLLGNVGGIPASYQIWNYENGFLRFGTNATERVRIDATGNVGIGTSSPALPLHISNSSAALAYFESTNVSGAYVIWRNSGTSIGDVGSQVGISGTGSASNFMIASRSGDMILGSNSSERMRITNTGNVGIGTSSPLTTLQVGNTTINNAAIGSSLVRLLSRSTANDVQEIGLGGEGSATMSAIGNIVTDGGSFAKGAIYFATRDVTTNTAPTERMRITSAGNVGIGYTSPTQKLSVAGNIKIAGAQAGNIAKLNLTRTDFSWLMSNETDLRFYSQSGDTDSPSTLNVAFTTAGNVGIGTSSPDNVLDLGQNTAGRSLTWNNQINAIATYSSGDLMLANNFYGNTASDSFLTSTTATFGAAGVRISATGGPSTGGYVGFFANAAAAKTAGAAFTPTEICRVTPNGLTFNGDTAAANALDDYEEGTWTPTTSTAGYTISASNGSYTKIGRQVSIRCQFTFSAVNASSTSAVQLTGLPFTNSAFLHAGVIRESDNTGVIYTCVVDPSATTIFANSMDGVGSGSQRPFAINENYVLSVVYFV